MLVPVNTIIKYSDSILGGEIFNLLKVTSFQEGSCLLVLISWLMN
jgi:hypothetical protein